MRMTIERMLISNFKGTRELVLEFGETTRIRGMNGTGKSTIPDAFMWVLFNKDSHGNAPGSDNFREKPLDEDGKEVHNLDTTVELCCKLDGQPFNLRRTQREKWVKKRGNAEAVFQGNESTYWINEVETKLSDFKARIAMITSEEVFRLIASLSAFNQIEWKKRRQQLLEMSGTDVDGELLLRPEYRPIADEAGQRNIAVDDLRKVLTDQRKRMNDELRMIPVRIDEAKRAMPEVDPQKIRDAEYIVKDSEEDIERISGYIAAAREQGGAGANRQQLLALETELVSLKRQAVDAHAAHKRLLQTEADAASTVFRSASARLAQAKQDYEVCHSQFVQAEAFRNSLRQSFTERRDEVVQVGSVCPTCGQELPESEVEAARVKANEAKKADLAAIKQRGVKAAEEVEALSAKAATLAADVEALKTEVDIAMKERDEAYARLQSLPDVNYSASPRIMEVEQQLAELKQEFKTSPDEKIRGYEDRKKELQAIVTRNRLVLAQRDAAEKSAERIRELTASQQELGARIAEVENLIVLVEKFVQDRCGALEASINAQFPTVRWKLFDIQINGGIVDVCTCMIPCGDRLVAYECANTAAQVNADIEIINVLSRHYDLQLPLFVDNSERVNTLAPTESQLITLSVSTDEKLKVEYGEAI